ncbi:hypothetical protein FRB93_005708 [Tulasnella sp. JGI-2019a]|nr:hypothetical protein FRB93_005708 [Tulasnella sp. JGI-2019a]
MNNKTHTTDSLNVAFNGADILRLSNFPANVISALRKLFEEQHLFRGFRDDQELGVSEFIMADKVWTSGKSSRTERLVTLIFSVILSHHFKLLTTLAYGRLAQDTCSLVFSKVMQNAPPSNGSSAFTYPGTTAVRNQTPPPAPAPNDAPSTDRTTFALSLTSKCLRVVRPPKSCTPGILASVRSAWPRGVVSESRPEDDVYEFNLKGYSLFSASTFERDALAHIFTLLRALDAQSLQLISNLNLTQGIAKSRSKDLWIFDAPADPPSPDPSLSPGPSERRASLVGSGSGNGPNTGSIMSGPGVAGLGAGYTQYLMEAEGAKHIRAATDPSDTGTDAAMIGGMTSGHNRSASAPSRPPVVAAVSSTSTANKHASHGVLRKTPPTPLSISVGQNDSQGTGSVRGRDRLDTTGMVMPLGHEAVSPLSIKMPEPHPSGQGPTLHQTGQSYVVVDAPPTYSHHGRGSSYPQPVNFGDGSGLEKVGAAGAVGAATVAQGQQQQRDQHHRHMPASPASPGSSTSPGSEDDARLLHGNAFRSSGYSFTTEGRLDTGRSTTMNDDDDDGQMTPRMGNTLTRTGDLVASQNVDDERFGMMQGPQDIRRKSEKALLGFITAEPEQTPPIPEQKPNASGWDRMASGATMYPPGGFPKTPPTLTSPTPVRMSSSGSAGSQQQQQQQQPKGTPPIPPSALAGIGSAPLIQEMGGAHQRTTSQTTDRSTGTARSGRRPKSPANSSKGWVLVNVEPRPGMKTSNSYSGGGAASGSHHHLRNQSELSQSASVRNVRKNHPGDSAGATAPANLGEPSSTGPRVKLGGVVESPQQQQQLQNNSSDELIEASADFLVPDNLSPTSPIPPRRASLKKRPPPPPKDTPPTVPPNGEVAAKRGFLGIFGSKKKRAKKAATAASVKNGSGTDGTTDEDTDPAGSSPTVERTEMTWKGRRQKSY